MKDFLAWYGAVMATIAIACQIRGWLLDRANLKVEGEISIVHTDKLDVVLTISAVNNGRRPVIIKRVAVCLTKTCPPPGLSPERRAELLKMPAATPVSVELALFGGEEKVIELSPDGDREVWKCPLTKDVEFLTQPKENEQYGTGYVMLTSGRKIFFEFPLLHNDQWPPFNVSQNLPTSSPS